YHGLNTRGYIGNGYRYRLCIVTRGRKPYAEPDWVIGRRRTCRIYPKRNQVVGQVEILFTVDVVNILRIAGNQRYGNTGDILPVNIDYPQGSIVLDNLRTDLKIKVF